MFSKIVNVLGEMNRLHFFCFSFALLMPVACGQSSDSDPTPPSPATPPGAPPSSTTTPPSTTTSTAPAPPTPTATSTAPIAPAGPASLHDNRDRLIDTLAARKNLARCPLWTSLTPTQRGVFLTISDLLGKRSFMTNPPTNDATRAGPDLDMALDHVTKVYEIRDSNGSDGGEQNNRIFLQFDTTLITAMRNFDADLPEWGKSTDIGGPHAPFDDTSETSTGQPRGQSQFWSDDTKSVALTRPGVEGINDPHIVEIDIDYDVFHHSNPASSYFPDGKGIDHYAAVWTPVGMGTDPEFNYVPSTCTN